MPASSSSSRCAVTHMRVWKRALRAGPGSTAAMVLGVVLALHPVTLDRKHVDQRR